MAEAFKVLGQANPLATTLTDLYTVPGSTETTVSTVAVANRTSSKVEIRISVAIAGAADSLEQYIAYDMEIPANGFFYATIGMSLAATDKVRVYTDTAGVSFNLFGVEIT